MLMQARALLLALLLPFCESKAACLRGEWLNATWTPACTLPTLADAVTQCLASKNILLIGDSTVRQLVHILAARWGLGLERHPCNLTMGYGCFDCTMGCHNEQYHHKWREEKEWADLSLVSPAGYRVWFSWKPSMYSLDDAVFLDSLANSKAHFDVIYVHKGTHAALDWMSLRTTGMPEALFLDETRVRATLLARTLKGLFPQASLIYRDIYHNFFDNARDAIGDKVRAVVTPIFAEHEFSILPGHDVMAAAPAQLSMEDGVHPHGPVVETMMLMMADIMCPVATKEA